MSNLFAYGNTSKCQMPFNEDAYFVGKIQDYIVLMVADGNGGFAGQINAGALAISTMKDYLLHFIKPTTSIIEIQNNLETGFFLTSRSFLAVNSIDERYVNLYASLTVAIIEEVSLKMVVGSIGNCELRMFRNGQFTRLNELHTEAFQLFKQGAINEEELYVHPKRATVTSACGIFQEPTIEILQLQLQQEDILFLTSDGLYRILTPNQILQILAENADSIPEAVNKVLKEADTLECPDNASLIVGYVQNDNGLSEQRQARYTQQPVQMPRNESIAPTYAQPQHASRLESSPSIPHEDSSPSSSSYYDGTTSMKKKKKKKSYLYY